MNILASDLLTIWSHTLWRASWRGAVAILAAWLCEQLWRTMPATWRSWMWRAVFAQLALCLLVPFDIPLAVLPAEEAASISGSVAATEPRSADSHVLARQTSVQPEQRAITAPAAQPLSGAPVESPSAFASGVWLLALAWLAGVGWRLHACYCDRRWVNRTWLVARRLPHRFAEQCLAQLAARFRLSSPPRLGVAEELPGPCLVAGPLWRSTPAILLPLAWLRQCTAGQLQLALAHELAHLSRRDLGWNQLVVACQAAFFFHPLVWLATRRYLAAQELACDALALERSGGSPLELARMLVQLAEQPVSRRLAGVAAVTGATAALKERIVAMHSVRRTSPPLWSAMLVCGVLGAALAPLSLAQKPGDKPASKVAEGATSGETPAKPQTASKTTGGFASASASAGGFSGGFANGGGAGQFGKSFSTANAEAQVGGTGAGKKPAAKGEFKSPGEAPAKPSAPKNSSQSRMSQNASASDDNGVKKFSRTTEVANDEHEVKIVESGDAITMEITDLATGKRTKIAAASRDELKAKDPEAFEIFQKYVKQPAGKVGAAAAAGGLNGLGGLKALGGLKGLKGLPDLEALQRLGGLEGLDALKGLKDLKGLESLKDLEGFKDLDLDALKGLGGLGGAQGLGGGGGANEALDLLKKQLEDLKAEGKVPPGLLDQVLEQLEQQAAPK